MAFLRGIKNCFRIDHEDIRELRVFDLNNRSMEGTLRQNWLNKSECIELNIFYLLYSPKICRKRWLEWRIFESGIERRHIAKVNHHNCQFLH